MNVNQTKDVQDAFKAFTNVAWPERDLPPDDFGLVVGKMMHHLGILELPVRKDGLQVGMLTLSTATGMGITMTAIAWERVEADEIQHVIHQVDGHDLPLSSGVYASFDSEGLARLDAHRSEIIESLLATITSIRNQERFKNVHSDAGKSV
jgi:hypothetical protein